MKPLTQADYDYWLQTPEAFPRLDGVRLLWHHDFYDGPLSGMCEHTGERLWYRVCDEGAYNRLFLCHRPTPEQAAVIESSHAKFQRMVGLHTDYDYDGDWCRSRTTELHRGEGALETWQQYYAEDEADPVPDDTYWPATAAHIVGWFSL